MEDRANDIMNDMMNNAVSLISEIEETDFEFSTVKSGIKIKVAIVAEYAEEGAENE